jgi:hypothetical protein
MIPSENGLVFGEIWYVTSQKNSKNSPHIHDCISVRPQASGKVPGHQIKYIQTLKEANHYMWAGQVFNYSLISSWASRPLDHPPHLHQLPQE